MVRWRWSVSVGALGLAWTSLAGSLAASTPTVRCDYAQKIECTSTGCQPSAIAGAFLRTPMASDLVALTAGARDAASLPAIELCDAKGCTPIVVRAVRSGAFLNVAQDGGAHFVKVAMVDIPPGIRKGDFVEVAARFLTTTSYVGSCTALVH
jgi:hypothetical protein